MDIYWMNMNLKKIVFRSKREILLITLILIIFFIIQKSSFENFPIGIGDFRPYWSATYLLAHGQDFSDISLMDHIERTFTGWNQSFTMMAWFAPTGMVVLLPFTLLPFEKAAFLWLLINILILCITAFLLWEKENRRIWIPLLAIFTFPMTLLSLYVGQINTLVLFGLTIYLSLEKSKHQYLRGVGLALTTIKPHLVILTLPLIILDSIYHKQWKILLGFLGAILFSVIILFAFYPPWISSFWDLIFSGMSTLRETPTISGLIVHMTGQGWGKWLWIPALLFTLIYSWINKESIQNNEFIQTTLIVGLLLSPIGWSYDQIMLIIPIVYLLYIGKQKKLSKKSWFTLFSLTTIYIFSTFMRINSLNEVWFFIVPLIIGVIYNLNRNINSFKIKFG